MEFKGTKGKWQLEFISGICVGVGTELSEGYSQMIVNTILPENDAEYKKEKTEILANAKLIAAAPELLEALKNIMDACDGNNPEHAVFYFTAQNAINKALHP